MRSFTSFLFVGATVATDCQTGDFCVTSCNDADNNNRTAMFLSVDKDYMDSHHPDLLTDWTLNGNDYTRTIQGSALTLDMTDSDYIFLDYELETAQVDVAGTTDIYFAGRTTGFRCRYPRLVSVGGNYTVTDDPDPSPYVNTGVLQYDLTTTVANGRTEVIIAEQHGVPGLEANVQNCAVTYAPMPDDVLYPVRFQPTWGDSNVCIDNRIATTFTYSNGGATVDWRTFHFNDPNAAAQQQQEVTCEIDVSNTLSVSAPSNCACHDRDACRAVVNHPNEVTISHNNLLAQGLTIPSLWKLKFDFFLDPNLHVTGTSQSFAFNYNVFVVAHDELLPTMTCGDSYPRLFVDTRLPNCIATRHCVGSNGNYAINCIPEKPNAWQSYEFGQREENGAVHFYMIVDGTEIVNVANGNPQSFSNMRMYAGEPDFGQSSAGGRLRNIILTDESVF